MSTHIFWFRILTPNLCAAPIRNEPEIVLGMWPKVEELRLTASSLHLG